MTVFMQRLLKELSQKHFPYEPAPPSVIDDFERRMGWRLDPDLRAFYLHCNGAELFTRLPDSPCQILPLEEIVRARVAIRREDDDHWGPESMYALCDVQDGNYVVLDVARQVDGRYSLVDGDHEAWPDPRYCERIAHSFSEFLEKSLCSAGRSYWLRR